MSQAKTIQQLQGDVTTAEGKVQQVGASLQAEQKRAERLSSEIRSNEQRYEGLKDEIRSLSAELEGLYSQLNGLDNENDEDGSRAAAVESEIARCQSERSDCEEEIRDVKAELSQQKQERQAAQARIRQYAGLLRQHRQALQQVDQIFVGHIEERSMVRSGMEQISRMKYGASAGPRAGQLAQDIQTCEQERQKVASLQTEITRYLGDGVTVQAPAAQKGTMSGPGGAGRASASAAGTQAPGTAPQTWNKMPDAGPSRIETAQTTAADIAPPPVVSMAPPGGRQQTDVSDIRQMAQENRGKWADEAGFMCAGAESAAKKKIKGYSTLSGNYIIDTEATMATYRAGQNESGKKWFDSVKNAGIGWKAKLKPAGTRYYMTSDSSSVGNPAKKATGNFLAEEYPGNTDRERKENLQLGTNNDGGSVDAVESIRATLVFESSVAPQEEWAKECGYKARVGIKQTFTPTYDIKGAIHAGIYRVVRPGEEGLSGNVRRAHIAGNQRVVLVLRRTDKKERPQKTVEANGYSFTTDEATGTTVIKGELKDKMASRKGMPQNVGGSLKEPGDHRGHGVAARFNGPAIEPNISSQQGKLNLGGYKQMENAEAALLKNGERIQTERIAYSHGKAADGSARPDAYMVNDTITNRNGETRNVHLSFANISPQEQEKMQTVMEELDLPETQNDGLRAQMTTQEYNKLMQETDAYLPDVKGEFEQSKILKPNAGKSRRFR